MAYQQFSALVAPFALALFTRGCFFLPGAGDREKTRALRSRRGGETPPRIIRRISWRRRQHIPTLCDGSSRRPTLLRFWWSQSRRMRERSCLQTPLF